MDIYSLLLTLGLLLAIDSIGLGMIIKPQFSQMAKEIGLPIQINYLAILPVYLLMAYGFVTFVGFGPDSSPTKAFLFGVVTHGIYELTNAATISGWRPSFILLDTIWGGILYWSVYQIIKNW